MIKKVVITLCKYLGIAFFAVCLTQQAKAQTASSTQSNQLELLRSDVGIHGLTANIHWLSDFTYEGTDTLQYDGSSELEFVYRNVRMMSPHVGIGYQLLTSFFVDGEDSGFGVGSLGAGPILRAYPFKTERFQPYIQANSLFGKDLAVSTLANTREGGDGFRIRLGLRAGLAVRLSNTVGLFAEAGYDWESSVFFKTDARAFQTNIGIDFYLFN